MHCSLKFGTDTPSSLNLPSPFEFGTNLHSPFDTISSGADFPPDSVHVLTSKRSDTAITCCVSSGLSSEPIRWKGQVIRMALSFVERWPKLSRMFLRERKHTATHTKCKNSGQFSYRDVCQLLNASFIGLTAKFGWLRLRVSITCISVSTTLAN